MKNEKKTQQKRMIVQQQKRGRSVCEEGHEGLERPKRTTRVRIDKKAEHDKRQRRSNIWFEGGIRGEIGAT